MRRPSLLHVLMAVAALAAATLFYQQVDDSAERLERRSEIVAHGRKTGGRLIDKDIQKIRTSSSRGGSRTSYRFWGTVQFEAGGQTRIVREEFPSRGAYESWTIGTPVDVYYLESTPQQGAVPAIGGSGIAQAGTAFAIIWGVLGGFALLAGSALWLVRRQGKHTPSGPATP